MTDAPILKQYLFRAFICAPRGKRDFAGEYLEYGTDPDHAEERVMEQVAARYKYETKIIELVGEIG